MSAIEPYGHHVFERDQTLSNDETATVHAYLAEKYDLKHVTNPLRTPADVPGLLLWLTADSVITDRQDIVRKWLNKSDPFYPVRRAHWRLRAWLGII